MQKIFLFLIVVLLATACGPSTVIQKSWRDPNVTVNFSALNKVLVVAFMRDETTRRTVEDKLVARLNGKGVASYNYFQDRPKKEMESSMREKLKAAGFDGSIVMRLINIDKEQNWVPGNYPMYYGRFWPYYWYSFDSFYQPGYYTEDKIYNVETNVYSFTEEKLVWSGLTATTNPSKIDKMFTEIADVVFNKMKSEGFITNTN